MNVSRLIAIAIPSFALFAASYASCVRMPPDESRPPLEYDGDAADAHPYDAAHDAFDSGTDGDGAVPPWGTLPAWDPTWHQTAPYNWPEVSHDGLSCGAGCTVLSAYEPHSFIQFSLEGDRLAYNTVHMNGTDTFTLLVDLKTTKEYLIDDGKSEPKLPDDPQCEAAIPALRGDSLLYLLICRSHQRLTLRSLVTGEAKTVELLGPLSEGTICGTGLTPTHAYWLYCPQAGTNTISSFNLTTAEVKTTSAGICRTLWIRSGPNGDVVLCTSEGGERIVLIDIAKNQASFLSPSSFSQNHGYLSPDGTQAVWLDYRDPGPNGEHGSYDFEYAGEIYWKNLLTGEERRLTFDNPTDPVKKAWPSIRDGIVVWEDWRTLDPKNPMGGQGYYLLSAPVRFLKDLDAGAQNLGPAELYYPQATEAGVVGIGGATDADGGGRGAIVRYAWP